MHPVRRPPTARSAARGSQFLRAATALLVVVLGCTLLSPTPVVDAWGYQSPDYPSPAQWSTLFPTCRNSVDNLQAPIALGAFAEQLGIQQFVTANGTSATTSPSTSLDAAELWEVDGTFEPLTLRASTAVKGLLSGEVLNKPFHISRNSIPVNSTDSRAIAVASRHGIGSTYYLAEFWIHKGAEHVDIAGNSAFSPTAEVQFLFRDSESSTAQLLLCQPLFEAAAVPDASVALNPLAEEVISMVYSGRTQTTATVVQQFIDVVAPATLISTSLFPNSVDSGSRGRFVSYNGSVTTPPCEANVTVLVSQHLRVLSTDALTKLNVILFGTVTSSGNGIRPLQSQVPSGQYTLRNVEIINDVFSNTTTSEGSTNTTTRTVPKENLANSRLRVAIICLLVVVVVEIALVGVLLAARWEYIDISTAWGGLARPMEVWENPTSHHTWEVVQSEEDGHDDEEEEDEEEEGDEEEEDDDDDDEWG